MLTPKRWIAVMEDIYVNDPRDGTLVNAKVIRKEVH